MALTRCTESSSQSSSMTSITLICDDSSINAQYPLYRLWHRIVFQKYKCIPLASRIRLRDQKGLQEFWGIGYKIFEFAVHGVYRDDGIFADVGMTIFQAGTADRDQQLRVFGNFFVGNGGLHREYIRLNVAGDNHHEVREKRIQFHTVLTISFRIALLYVRSAKSYDNWIN